MADSMIGWTGKCWNIIGGCTNESTGCLNCWSRKLVGTRFRENPRYDGLTVVRGDGKPHWTGKISLFEDRLEEPMHWRKPQLVFVASQADLFHPGVPEEFIDRAFAIMALCPHHTFQILTKRPQRMREYLSDEHEVQERIATALGKMLDGQWIWNEGKRFRNRIERMIGLFYGYETESDEDTGEEYDVQSAETVWPLRNVWLGTSTENQETFDKRAPELLDIAWPVHWLSIEPQVGSIVIPDNYLRELEWIVLGGESGTGARPMHPDWARSVRDQCEATGIPFFFKQTGEWLGWQHQWGPFWKSIRGDEVDSHAWPDITGEEPEGWIADLHDDVVYQWVGKKAAGDILDGKRYQQFPR